MLLCLNIIYTIPVTSQDGAVSLQYCAYSPMSLHGAVGGARRRPIGAALAHPSMVSLRLLRLLRLLHPLRLLRDGSAGPLALLHHGDASQDGAGERAHARAHWASF